MSFNDDDSFGDSSIEDAFGPNLVDDGAFTELEDSDEVDWGNADGDSPIVSDQTHDFQLRAEATVGPNGEALDEIDAKYQYREMKRAEDNKLAPSVSIVPPSWDSGTLGGSAQIKPNQDTTLAGPIQPLVFWEGEDRESCPVTITVNPLDLPLPNGTGTVGTVRPIATIKWGTRNGTFEVDIDIGTGVQLVLCASAVYVSAYLDGGSDTPITVSAGIGFYASSPRNPATRTAYIDNQGSGATVSVPRAKFSSTIVAFERADTTFQYTLAFLDINSQTIGRRVIQAGTYLTSPIILPNDVVQVDVINGGGAGAKSRLVYGVL